MTSRSIFSRFLASRLRLAGFAFLLLAGFAAAPVYATTYYVRPDGGSATQCTGASNTAYSGSGNGQACAWSHPFIALPPMGTPRIAGGDTLVIGRGSYMMGYGAPGAEACNTGNAFMCSMAAVPSGPSASQPTRILGQGFDNGCSAAPELWGTERAPSILNLTGSSNVEVACLEVTDHSSCIENHCQMTGTCSGEVDRCKRDGYPYGTWAENGLVASDSRNVTLQDLNIHGLANDGVRAGRLTDWTMIQVKIVGNGFGGWDGDIRNGVPTADTSNHGNIVFRGGEIGFNGCGERYPGGQIFGCWGQNEGGYGDGVGTGPTGGNWVFEDMHVHHNTQDGIDLLYADGTGSITIERVLADGNAGNQLKIAGNSSIANSVVVGNCAYFSKPGNIGVGNMQSSDSCRASGDTIAILAGNDVASPTNINHAVTVTVQNNTIAGEGNGLIMLSRGNPDSHVYITSNAMSGSMNWHLVESGYPELTGGVYYYPRPGTDDAAPSITYADNLFWNLKNDQCPMGSLCENPRFTNGDIYAFNALPTPSSPLINRATAANSTLVDFRNKPRPSSRDGVLGYDIGAIQYQGMADNQVFKNGFD